MKAKELKIGDYFFIENTPVKIKTLADGDISVVKYGEVAPANIGDLIPIPLTSEILEKNGWEKDIDKYGYTYYQHNGWYRLLIAEQEGSWAFSHYDDFLTTIQSVHELQHILWALGMDDDLKI